MHTPATAREYYRLRMTAIAREGVATLPQAVLDFATRYPHADLPPHLEELAAVEMVKCKEQLRERCDRSKPEGPVEVTEIAIRDCGIRGGY